MAKIAALAAFLNSAAFLDRKTAHEVLQVNDLDLPRGAVTEVIGPRSSGRGALLHKILAASIAEGETCALIDASDGFDPTSAAANGVNLDRIFWVRCGGRADHAMTAADWILHAGGFGAVALDLCEIALEALRQIPLSWWYRFRNAIQHTRTAFVVVAGAHLTGSCAARILAMEQGRPLWSSAVPTKSPQPATATTTVTFSSRQTQRLGETGYPFDSRNRHDSDLVGRTPWSARDAPVPLPEAKPGGSARARAPAPLGSADDAYVSEADSYLGEISWNGTSSLLEGIGVTLVSRKPEAAKPARYEARLAE
jgi:recA bacterial DNA recombination protein